MMMRTQRNGFTLIELLVVLGIIGLLVAISIPALNSISKGADLGNAASLVSGQLNLARQSATTMSRPMEVRIYETKDSQGDLVYNGLGIYEVGEDSEGNTIHTLQNKIVYLPSGAAFSSGALSTLIQDAAIKDEDTIPGKGTAKYSAFRFTSSGGADLEDATSTGTAWTLTILPKKDLSATALPTNYAVLTLNAVIGTVRVDRP